MLAKALNAKVHGALDYLAVLAFFVIPSMLGLSGMVAQYCYGVAVCQLVLSLMTKYPAGLLRVIPFPAHGVLEFLEGVALIALPWMAGFASAELARNLFVASGVGLLIIWSLTDYTDFWRSSHVVSGATGGRVEEEELTGRRF